MNKLNAQIDRTPPRLTGNAKNDLQNVMDYLVYLQEKHNELVNLLNKERGN